MRQNTLSIVFAVLALVGGGIALSGCSEPPDPNIVDGGTPDSTAQHDAKIEEIDAGFDGCAVFSWMDGINTNIYACMSPETGHPSTGDGGTAIPAWTGQSTTTNAYVTWDAALSSCHIEFKQSPGDDPTLDVWIPVQTMSVRLVTMTDGTEVNTYEINTYNPVTGAAGRFLLFAYPKGKGWFHFCPSSNCYDGNMGLPVN